VGKGESGANPGRRDQNKKRVAGSGESKGEAVEDTRGESPCVKSQRHVMGGNRADNAGEGEPKQPKGRLETSIFVKLAEALVTPNDGKTRGSGKGEIQRDG